VVWFVVAGGAAFGIEDCAGGVVAGRVAVVGGGDVDCAVAAVANNKKALDSSDAASAVEFGFIDLAPVGRSMKTAHAAERSRYASNCLPIGSARMRLPVAAKIALISAGANGGTPGSPTPLGGVSGPAGTM
jgi:hypothetical protein